MTRTIGEYFTLLSVTRDGHGCRAWRRLVAEWEFGKRWPYLELEGASDISQARSELASRWLAEHRTPWAVWIDDDMVCQWEAFEHFLEVALEHSEQLDVLAATYPGKKAGGGHIATLFANDQVALGRAGNLEPIQGTGFGLVATKRDVFKRLEPTLPLVRYERSDTLGRPYFLGAVLPAPGDYEGAARHSGEDFAFCFRALQVGARLFADTRFRLGHRGPYTYFWEDIDAKVERVESIAMNRIRKGER